MQGKPKLKQKWDYNLGGLDNAPKPKPTAFYIDSILKDMDSMTYKIKFKNACDGTTHPIIEIPLDNSKGLFAGTLAWQLLNEQFPDAILVEKPDKSKLNEVAELGNWIDMNKKEKWGFEAIWPNPFYKKQNELAMKALENQDLHIHSFPTYTKGGGNLKAPSPKKKINKVPEVKPGDDWWIVL